ncbi:MAG: NAD(P)-dependent alcohol dehydrogenase [Ilumatobacteraceae bacterium]
MRALQLTEWQHDPELREVAEPDPEPGEVVVRIGAAGVCHSDLHVLYEFPPGVIPADPPFTLGHENAGWVEALGAGVTGLQVGDPVAVYGSWGCGHCIRCRQGLENYCVNPDEAGAPGGLGRDGGMAPLMLVPSARLVVPLGDLDPTAAAPLTDAGLTPYHAIRRSLPKLLPGSFAVVIGVGGLGHMAVQLLSALTSATIIAVDQRSTALELAASSGAHRTVVAGDDAAAEIRDATGGVGADVVLDVVGSDATMRLAVAVSRPLSDVTVIGIAGGSVPFGFFATPYEVSLQTTYWGSVVELMEVLELARRGVIRAEVTTFSLDDATQAYEALRSGSVRGRAVVVP